MKIKLDSKIKNSFVKICCVMLILTVSVSADCQYRLFNITSANGTKIRSFVNQLSKDCQFTVIVRGKYTKNKLKKRLSQTYIKNMTLNEVFKLILSDRNLFYTFKNNILTITYLQTKTFNIDYILSQRKGVGSTDIALGSNNNSNATGGLMTTGQNRSSSSATNSSNSGSSTGNNVNSGISITSTDEVQFWNKLSAQLQRVMNRPEDRYIAQRPIINKNAGLITVTATSNQLKRLSIYLQRLQKKVELQVLIDVQLLTVTMDKSKTTGIDWSKLYSLGDINAKWAFGEGTNGASASGTTSTSTASTGSSISSALGGIIPSNYISITGGASLSNIIKFLKTQGSVKSISNPKILTLNNQPALITSGTQYFYTIKQSANQQGSSGGVASTVQNNVVKSVFAGILLDITPEISNNNMITLKINPSISETADTTITQTSATRTTPPDLSRRQLSSVVTVKNGSRIILGGLIHTITTVNDNKVPILGDIPGLSYLFSHTYHAKQVQELVIIIQPHIIRNKNSKLSLSDLGYESITKSMLHKNIDTNLTKKVQNARGNTK